MTDFTYAPWHFLRSDDERRVRLNCISHILPAANDGAR
jgi:polyphosphate kinase 2 (PPK2 family)